MTDYTCGFAFSLDGTHVALIEKKRPLWQHNMLNGIGGHVEPGETALNAQIREFAEETGGVAPHWCLFATLTNTVHKGKVAFYYAYMDLGTLWQRTDEELVVVPVDDLPSEVVDNLRYLIPLALAGDTQAVITENRSLKNGGK